MNKKKRKQRNRPLLTLRTGEQFCQDLLNAPYNEEDLGKSFVIIRMGGSRVQKQENKESKEEK
jgi:hypothetical protein